MRRGGEEFLDYLRQERADFDARLVSLADRIDDVASELRSLTPESERSVSWEHGPYTYYTLTPPGRELSQLRCNDRLLVDLAEWGSPYAALGIEEPNERYLAYSVDLDGSEVYALRFRNLETGIDLPIEIEPTYYGGAWLGDYFFYTVPDQLNRPCEIHRVNVATGEISVVLTEPDQRFELDVEASRSGDHVVITSASRDTTEVWAVSDPLAPPLSLRGRTPGVEYRAERDAARDRWVYVTNDTAVEFHLTATDLDVAFPGERVHDVLAFGDCLVTYSRREGRACIRIMEPDGTTRHEFGPDEVAGTIRLGRNPSVHRAFVTVATESFTSPTTWWDIDLVTGARSLRFRREVPGHDPSLYVGQMVDDIVVVRHRDTPLDGTAPCLLYGYGSYESIDDPWFDIGVLPLLNRGVIFAKAHIRGGGELGRQSWIDGHLLAKRNTFDDFIAAADRLADGLVSRIVSRGLSAGGLLQGAVYFMRPDRWAGVIAEVPFVDVVNSMLDVDIPLTVIEWDEWGDPREPEVREYLESYTPYINRPAPHVRPALLVTGAVHDPRVLVHEPAKWVAALRHDSPGDGQAASPGSVMFRVELAEGAHSGPAGRFAALDYEAEVVSWALEALGLQSERRLGAPNGS